MARYENEMTVEVLTRTDINRLYYAAVEAKILWKSRRQSVEAGTTDTWTVEECNDMIYLYRDLEEKMYWMDTTNMINNGLSRELWWNEEKAQNDETLDYYYGKRQDGVTRSVSL